VALCWTDVLVVFVVRRWGSPGRSVLVPLAFGDLWGVRVRSVFVETIGSPGLSSFQLSKKMRPFCGDFGS